MTDKELDPKADAALDNFDRSEAAMNARLDTGMKVGEAITRAMLWWENRGRKAMREARLPGNRGRKFLVPNPTSSEEGANSLPSGILNALPWEDLTRDEKLSLAKTWHHQFVRITDLDPEAYLRRAVRPGNCFYCGEASSVDETLASGEIRELCWAHFKDRYPAQAMLAEAKPLGEG